MLVIYPCFVLITVVFCAIKYTDNKNMYYQFLYMLLIVGFLAFSVVFYCCDLLQYVEHISWFLTIFNYLSFLVIPISLFLATHILFNDLLKYVFKPKQRQAYAEEVRMNQPIFENNTHRYNENIDPIDISNVRVTFRINNVFQCHIV